MKASTAKQRAWKAIQAHEAELRDLLFTGLALILLLAALGLGVANAKPTAEAAAVATTESNLKLTGELIALAGVLVFGGLAVVWLVRSLGWKTIRAQRSFDLIVLIGTLTLPQLTAFPVRMLGWDPLDYTTAGMTRTALVLVPLFIISILVGLWWKPRFWLSAAAIFYAIFTVFYTTFFTNGKGFFMGLVASLGYWLSQQGVERGSQPLYYYLLLQIPVYEYLAAIGALTWAWGVVAVAAVWTTAVTLLSGYALTGYTGATAAAMLVLYILFVVYTLRSCTKEKCDAVTVREALPVHAWSAGRAGAVMALSMAGIALMSELLVASVEAVTEILGLTPFFVGIIIVPIIGNVAEHLVSVQAAMQNKMDLSLSIALGSSLQIALFVTPVLGRLDHTGHNVQVPGQGPSRGGGKGNPPAHQFSALPLSLLLRNRLP